MPITHSQSVGDILVSISNRLKDAHSIQEISNRKENFMPYIQAYPWDITSLSHGYPGLIILFAEMDHFFPGEGWDHIAHRYIVDLMQEVECKGIHNTTLFSGLTGICFSIHVASKQGMRYQTLLSKLHPILINMIEQDYFQTIKEMHKRGELLSSFQYDVIAGISGVLSYLLEYADQEAIHNCAHQIVEHLVMLCRPIMIDGQILPGWYTPSSHLYRDEHKKQYPNGCFDTGIAHGIAGCLAALSKAYLKGIVVENQLEAIQEIATWLQNTRCQVGEIDSVWPSRFGFNQEKKIEIGSDFYRDGWCYGAPGIASALYVASQALKNEKLQQYSIDVMMDVCKRFSQRQNLECVSFCHGFAGLLTMIHRMNIELESDVLSETSQKILDCILDQYNPEHPFGFKSFTLMPQEEKEILIDNMGLLDGVTGTLLSLLFLKSPKQRPWTSIFLI